mmetsp:Transcript_9672/g.17398  ORF Transcript_9672/g.17398 Transcript_9672/m.17398 type:complete len:150 (+) Transcript_9672:98-547(+)
MFHAVVVLLFLPIHSASAANPRVDLRAQVKADGSLLRHQDPAADGTSVLPFSDKEPVATTTTTSTLYYTLFATDQACRTGTQSQKTNVGNYQTEACYQYVLDNPSCGKYFHFGLTDGYCECIGSADTTCNLQSRPEYHVFWIQKGGPEP